MSEIRATTISDLAGTGPATLTGQKGVKCYFDVDQMANVIIGSFNVSSYTDFSVGTYRVTFTNAFSTTSDFVQLNGSNTDERFIASRQVDLLQGSSSTSNGTRIDTNLNTGIVMGALA